MGFNRHFETNRAPLGLHFTATWLKQNKGFTRELTRFIDEMIDRNDVYFVTMLQVIQWMQNPTETTALRDFTEWKEKCDVKGQPYCSCQTLVLVKPENCLEKPFDYTLAWNVPIIILGSWIPLAMVSPSNKFDIPTPHTFTSTFVFIIIIVSFHYEPVLWENKLD